jgi:hypothetical protein
MCVKNVKTSKNFKWDYLRRNRFLIRFPKEINIFEWWIEKVTKHPILFDNKTSKKISITFRERGDCGDIVFYEEIRKFNNLDKRDRNIVFEDLDVTGYAVNREYFINCKAKEIRFDTCDYKNDKIKTCVVIFEYDDIINKL